MKAIFPKAVLVLTLLFTLSVASPVVSAQSDPGETGAESSDIPCAGFTYSPQYPEVGEPVRFFVSPASLPTCRTHYVRGYIRNYVWYLGSNNIPVDGGETTQTTFDEPGEHTVGLEATNHLGESTYYERTVVVGNTLPAPSFSSTPEQPEAGEVVRFDVSGSSDLENEIEEYRWATGDGTTGTGVRLEHTYDEPGQYEVTLTVDNGERTNSRTKLVTVGNTTGSEEGEGESNEEGEGGEGEENSGNEGNNDATGSGGGEGEGEGEGTGGESGNGETTGSGETGDGGNSTGNGDGSAIGESLDGFGVVLSVVALLATLLVARRRRKE